MGRINEGYASEQTVSKINIKKMKHDVEVNAQFYMKTDTYKIQLNEKRLQYEQWFDILRNMIILHKIISIRHSLSV